MGHVSALPLYKSEDVAFQMGQVSVVLLYKSKDFTFEWDRQVFCLHTQVVFFFVFRMGHVSILPL